MRWNQKTKIEDLMVRYGWAGTKPSFMDQLSELIGRVADPYRTVLDRYYLRNESQRMDPATGKPQKDDRRFYQHLVTGRAVLDGFFCLDITDLKKLQDLRRKGVY